MSAGWLANAFAGPEAIDNIKPMTRRQPLSGAAVDHGGPPIAEQSLPEDDFIALWRAVILQMFKDATNNWQGMEKDVNRSRAYHRNLRARAWLTGRWEEDFNDVCERARLDPGAVKKRGADLIAGRVTIDQGLDPIDHAKALSEEATGEDSPRSADQPRVLH